MKTTLRLALGAGLVCASLLTSCRTSAGDTESHWNIDSVDNRIVKRFTGYRGAVDGAYVDFQRQKKNDISKTLRRHFLNNNPDNPFQVSDSSADAPPRPHGPLPDPLHWFHMESIFVGGMVGGWGSMVLLPFDSLVSLFTAEGRDQFVDSVTGDWDGDLGRPPRPSTFRVKNR